MGKKPKPKHAEEKPAKKISTVKIILYCVLALLFAGMVIAGIFIYKVLNPSAAFSHHVKPASTAAQASQTPSQTPPSSAAPSVSPSPVPSVDPYEALLAQSDPEFMKDKANILMVGLDKSAEREGWNSFRTDTMIVAACNFKNKTMRMISLPRDSLVYVYPFKEMEKINTAFVKGGGAEKKGYDYAMKTVSRVLGGVPVDYYIGFDMTVVKKLVDAMGGVDYNVDIDVTMNGRTISKGMQHLNGQQVLDYCRQRHGSSDIARVDRQQRMLFEIFSQLKSTDQFKNLPEIFKAVQQNIQTNLDFTQICSLAFFGKDLDLAHMQRYTLPGAFLNINDISYWGIDQSAKKEMIKEIFEVSVTTDSSEDVDALKDMADKTRKIKNSAQKRIAGGMSYLAQNAAYIQTGEKNAFSQFKAQFNVLIAQNDVMNLPATIKSLESKINEYDAWFAALKADVSARQSPPASSS